MKLQEYKMRNRMRDIPTEYVPMLEHRWYIENNYIDSWQVAACFWQAVHTGHRFEGVLKLTCHFTQDFDLESVTDRRYIGNIKLVYLDASGRGVKEHCFSGCVINKYSSSMSYNSSNTVEVLFEIKFDTILTTNCLDKDENVK